MLVSGLVVPAAAALPGLQPAETTPAAGTEEPGSERAAQAEARASGEKVVVDSATTPTDQTVANPDGTFTRTMNTSPVRMETSQGWVDISTDLVMTVEDGKTVIKPEQVPIDVTLGAGGSNVMASIDDKEGHSIEQSWPFGSLPVPVLVENTATYRQVLPGVDLVQIANKTGVSQVLKIESAEAARDPRVAQMRLFLDTGNTTVTETGGGAITATGRDTGEVELHMSGGQWWDSSQSGASALDPGTPGLTRPFKFTLGEEAGKQTQVFGMDEILGASDVTYPIYVDPPWNVLRTDWVMVDTAYPNTSYWNGAFGTSTQNVGYIPPNWPTDGNAHLARSYFQFEGKTFDASADLINARFSVLETWSASCTPTGVASWITGEVGTGTTWNNQPVLGVRTDRGNVAKGWGPACPQGMVGFDLLAGESTLLTSSRWTIMLAADNELDTSGLAWKRFSNAGQVTVDYNRKPFGPAIHSVTNGVWAGTPWASKYVTRSNRPTLAVYAGDPDSKVVNGTTGGPITVYFSVRPKAGGANIFTGHVSNFTPEWGVATLLWGTASPDLADGDYILDAKGVDIFLAESPLMSFTFTVDTKGPQPPTLSLPSPSELTETGTDAQGNKSYRDLDNPTGTISYPIKITNGREFPARGFIYSVGPSSQPTPPVNYDCSTPPTKEYIVVCPGNGSDVTINIGAVSSTTILSVWAFDDANNITGGSYDRGTPRKATLTTVGQVLSNEVVTLNPSGAASWQTIEATGPVNTARTPKGNCVGAGTPGPDGAAYALQFTGGKAETATAAVNTTESFSMAAWICPSTTTANIQSVITQLAGTGPGASLEIGSNGLGSLRAWYSASTSQFVESDSNLPQGKWTYVTSVYDKINRQLRLTASTATATIGTWVIAASQPDVVASTNQKVLLGQNPAGLQKFTGQVYRPILTKGVLTNTQFADIQAAFKNTSNGTEIQGLLK